ncbi:MAG: T9SS type A sorting domain-containing protein [Bacteroidales bacterium]|nr:T9SS type A sorting domain-containing protein [Dysgonamonadaceae bacterium]
MQNKKLVLSAVFLLCIGLSGLQAQKALYLKEKSGAQTSFTLNDLRKLTFPAGSMMVNKTDGSTSTYVLSDIRSLNFSDLINHVSLIYKKECNNLTLYPNPVIDQLHIIYETFKEGSVQVEIIDFQARILYQQTILCQVGTNQATIPVTQLQRGLYLFSLKNGNNVEIIKFLKD